MAGLRWCAHAESPTTAWGVFFSPAPKGLCPAMELDSVVCATKHQVSSRLDDEVAILELERGVYYGLSRVGVRVWDLIQEPMRVRDVEDRLVSEYDVDAERCRA